MTTIGARIDQVKYDIFRWRYELTLPKKLALALAMAGLTALAAQVRIPLPWSPVPVTGQTFAVLLAGVLMGRWWGGISLALYAGLGMAGVPWFAGAGSGLAYLAGPTGGYIIGFIFAALFLGHVTDNYPKLRNYLPMLGLMLFANFVLIYVPGLVQLGMWTSLVKKQATDIGALLMMGAVPFIAGDITKAILAASIVKAITPKRSYIYK